MTAEKNWQYDPILGWHQHTRCAFCEGQEARSAAQDRPLSPLFCARCGAAFGSSDRKVAHRCEQPAAQDRELALRHIECADWILARASDLEMQAKELRNLAGKLLHPPPDTGVSVAWSNGVPTLRFVTTEEVRDAA